MGDIINRCHDNNYLYTYVLFHTDGNWLTCKIPLRKDKSFQCAGGFISMFVHFLVCVAVFSLQWRHNGRDSVSNHQPHDCLLNCLFRRRWKKHQSSAWLAFVWWIHRGPVNSPQKWPVTRKMFPFDDVIMSVICQYWFMGELDVGFSSLLYII